MNGVNISNMQNNIGVMCDCEKCTGKYCAKKVSIFSTLQDDQVREIADMVIHRKYKKGQIIFLKVIYQINFI